MANNRMYLVHVPSGVGVYLGKRMGRGWYDSPAQKVWGDDPIMRLFNHVEDQGGDQDAFEIWHEAADAYTLDVSEEKDPPYLLKLTRRPCALA